MPAFDAHANLCYTLVASAPTPADLGQVLTVRTGDGAFFPVPPFNATVWPIGVIPLRQNAEIVRITAVVGDTVTMVRAQESSTRRAILAGDQLALTLTAKTITDMEAAVFGAAGGGNVIGPAGGATTDAVVMFANTSGVLLKDSQIQFSQLARRDVPNTFLSDAIFQGTVFTIENSIAPSLIQLRDTAQATDLKTWGIEANGADFSIYPMTDGGAAKPTALKLTQGSNNVALGANVIAYGASALGLTPVTRASLPTSPVVGTLANISDSTTAVLGATVSGGGALGVLVRWNGTNWIVIGLNAASGLPAHASTHVPGGTDVLQMTGAPRLMGRASSGAGAVEELIVGTGLVLVGSTLTAVGSGDVSGPASATADAVALFSGTTGKVLKNSLVTVDAAGTITIPGIINAGAALTFSAVGNASEVRAARSIIGLAPGTTGQINLYNELRTIGIGLDVATDGVLKIRTRAQTADAVITAATAAPGTSTTQLATTAFVTTAVGAVPVGDVVGPASATADAVALYSGTTGKLLKNSTLTLTADVLELKNGAVVQAFRVYGTTTGSKFVQIQHDGTNANITTAGHLQMGALTSWIVRSDGHLQPGAHNTYDLGTSTVQPRTVFAGTSISIGTNPATTGAIRLQNDQWIAARNVSNTADILALKLGASDNLIYLGTSTRPSSAGSFNFGDPAVRWNGGFFVSVDASGSMSVGTNPATIGAVRLANNSSIYGRNAANTADIRVATLEATNQLIVGDLTANLKLYGSQIYHFASNYPASDLAYGFGGSGNRWTEGWFNNLFVAATVVTSYVAVGTNPAATGALRLANTGAVMARNAGNTADIELLKLDASNAVIVAGTDLIGALALKAPLASPALTGVPTAPTPAGGTNNTQIATTAFVLAATTAPAAHRATHETGGSDALVALSAAILTSGTLPDARLSANVALKPVAQADVVNLTTDLAAKAPLASPALTGVPTAPTAPGGTNTTQLATTAYVVAGLNGKPSLPISLTTDVTGVLQAAQEPAHSGDVTNTAGSLVLAIGASKVTNTMLAGSIAASKLVMTDITVTESQVTSLVADLALKAPLASPALTGTPLAPTAAVATNTTQIATTAFVKIQGYAPLDSPTFTGTPAAPTATAGTNNTQLATTAFVQAAMGAAGTGNVVGPATATADAIALYNGTTGKTIKDSAVLLTSLAPLASPAFTGVPTAPTASGGTATTQIATTQFVQGAVSAAGGGDVSGPAGATANAIALFNGTTGKLIKDSVVLISTLAPIASPALTGTPTAPTASPGTNTTQLATTAFVAASTTTPAAHHVSHETGGSDALVALSAAILTTGTLPNARLAADVTVTSSVAVGTNPAAAGLIRLANAQPAITARNAANTIDIMLLSCPVDNSVHVGDSTNAAATFIDSSSYIYLVSGASNPMVVNAAAGVRPGVDATFPLGGSTLRWLYLYVSESVRVGTNPATTGALRLANAGAVVARNAANSADVELLKLDASNIVQLAGTDIIGTLALKAPLASPALTGAPTAPTATAGTNTTQLATTAFVTSAVTTGTAVPAVHHVRHETGGADAIVALDAAVLTTGTINASRLPTTLTHYTGSYTWAQPQTVTGSVRIEHATPGLYLYETDGTTDKKFWSLDLITEELWVQTRADVGSTLVAPLKLTRTGDLTVLGSLTVVSTNVLTALNLKAPLASPALTGVPTAPTAATADNSTQLATTAFVKVQGYAPLASPALTGTPTAPTATAGTNTTQLATTAFVLSNAAPSGGAAGTVLAGGSPPTYTADPIVTSVTAPSVAGGTGTTSTLTLKPTSGAGTTGSDIIFGVGTNGTTEAMRIINGTSPNFGLVGLGTATPQVRLHVVGGSATTSSIYNESTRVGIAGATNVMQHSRAGAILVSGDTTGMLLFRGWDGTQWVTASEIDGYVDATPGANSMPGQLRFSTTPTGTTVPVSRLQIDNAGAVTISGSLAVAGINITSELALKAPLASPALTGTPTAPTAAAATNSTQIATTAYVKSQSASPVFTGSPTTTSMGFADGSLAAPVIYPTRDTSYGLSFPTGKQVQIGSGQAELLIDCAAHLVAVTQLGFNDLILSAATLGGPRSLLMTTGGVNPGIQFGGVTAAFPAIQRGGTTLAVLLADGSGPAPLTAATAAPGTNSTQVATTAFVATARATDVVGPASSTDNMLAVWNGTTGKLLKDSSVKINATGDLIIAYNDALKFYGLDGTTEWKALRMLPSTWTLEIGNAATDNVQVTARYFRCPDCYIMAGQNEGFYMMNASGFTSVADGVLLMSNWASSSGSAGADFNRLQFGWTTAAFPAIKRNGVGLEIKLADDSALTTLRCATPANNDNTTLVATTAFFWANLAIAPLPAANLTGAIADARLSSNVPLKNASNNFTGTNQFGGGFVSTAPGDISVARVNTLTTGAIYFGNTGSNYLYFDATNLNVSMPVTGAAQPRCCAQRAANQSAANATWLTLSFDTEAFDVGGCFSLGSPTAVYVPAGQSGIYMILAVVGFASGAGGRYIQVQRNGAGIQMIAFPNAPAGDIFTMQIPMLWPLVAGDAIQVTFYQGTGVTLNVTGSLSIAKLW